MNDVVIEVKNLNKIFKDSHFISGGLKKFLTRLVHKKLTKMQEHVVLNDVSFSVSKGESVAILGKNGAGKTTLFKLLSKVSYPDSGTISIKGKILSLLALGTGFVDELTGLENIDLYGVCLGFTLKEIRKIKKQIIEFSDINSQMLNTPMMYYSSGMISRLGFAVISQLSPKILILDEVFAVGDHAFQIKCHDWVKEYIKKGGTLLVVSHHEHVVMDYCSRALVLHEGSIVFSGLPKEALKHYNTL